MCYEFICSIKKKFQCARYRQTAGLGDLTSHLFYDGKVVIKRSDEKPASHAPFIVVTWDAENLPDEERCSTPEAELVQKLFQCFPFACGETVANDPQPHVLSFYVANGGTHYSVRVGRMSALALRYTAKNAQVLKNF